MPSKTPDDALMAAAALKVNMDFAARSRWRIRTILDGGAPAIRALLGPDMDDEDIELENVPWANWLLSGLTTQALKIGSYPKVRVDSPSDDQAPRDRAETKRQAVAGYDKMDRMEMQLPQVGRWLPGYGYAVWTIGARTNTEGVPYPKATLRDPFDTHVGEWGVDQQPREIAVNRVLPVKQAQDLFPDHDKELGAININQLTRVAGWGGAVLLGSSVGSWENQRGRGVQVVEYYDEDGIHILVPAIQKRVDFIPNPLDSGPCFVVAKRFAFNQLVGQYDHTLGLMAAGAKINALSVIFMEDNVFTETNVSGEIVGGKKYQKGRDAVNVLTPGSRVDKPQSNMPYQTFEIINRIERQFRNTAQYPIQDDANSPLSFATGAGLDELMTTPSLGVREYHKVIRHALQDVDAKRLEWDEKVSPNRRKTIGGKPSSVPRAPTYKPAEDFRGDYETRREHGMMAGWDDPQKIVAGLQMIDAETLDTLTFQENIDGFENLEEMNERIEDKKNRDMLHSVLLAGAQNGDLRAVAILIETLPESDFKESLKKYFTPQEPQMSEDEQAFMASGGQGGQDPMAQLFAGGQPSVQTVLSRLTSSGQTQGGVQTVGRL